MKKIATTDYIHKIAKELGYTVKKIDVTGTGDILKISKGARKCLVNNGLYGYYPTNLRWQSALFKDKITTQKFLKQNSIKTIPSKFFRLQDFSSCSALLRNVHEKAPKFPLIVKPAKGLGGQNITIAPSKKSLTEAVKVLYEQKKDFLIQRQLDHPEYRIFISHGEIMVIHSKNHKYIYSNGVQPIKKQLERVPDVEKSSTYITSHLKEMGWTLASVPEKGTKIKYHIAKDNTREFIETEHFPPKVVKWAKSLSSVTDGNVIGVDLFTPKGIESPDDYIVIELNANPSLRDYARTYKNYELSKKIYKRELEHYFK